ncbi:MAG: glucokinase [Rudaea sp.]
MHDASPLSVESYGARTGAASAAAGPFLAADVGGTHARIGLIQQRSASAVAHDEPLHILGYRKYACASHASLSAILLEYLRESGARPLGACIACAGYALGDDLINANLPWKVSISALRRDLGLERVALVNDFQAIAYATHFHPLTDAVQVAGSGGIDLNLPRLVVGPGTGFGAAVLLPAQPHPAILRTEAGHAAIAPHTALEMQVVRHLGRGVVHVPNEQVLSGPGLLNLYRAICEIRAIPARLVSPMEVTAAALDGSDAVASECVACFCAWLGGLVGDLVVLFGAFGGVSLAGGFLPQILALLQRSEFAERFHDKGTLRTVLERVPVHVIEHGQLGVSGAAHWFVDNAAAAI